MTDCSWRGGADFLLYPTSARMTKRLRRYRVNGRLLYPLDAFSTDLLRTLMVIFNVTWDHGCWIPRITSWHFGMMHYTPVMSSSSAALHILAQPRLINAAN